MNKKWEVGRLDEICEVEYGTRVVKKRDGGSIFPVYGGGGATFKMDTYNRENRLVIGRFAMSEQCTRFVKGKFFLNDSGLTLNPRDEEQLLPEFLNWQILSINDYIYSLGKGTAQKNLDIPAFRDIEIKYVLPLSEQKRIVSILDKAFDAIEKAKANAEENLKNSKELFESYLNNIFVNKDEDWKEKRIRDIARVINGYAFSSKDFKPTNSIKSIKITNVGVKEFVEEASNYLPEKFKITLKDVMVKKGNIVIALTRTIIAAGLKVAVVPQSYDGALVNQRVAALIPNENIIHQKFLYYFLTTSSVAKYVLSHVNTLMQPNLSINDLKNLPIPCPRMQKQQAIVHQLDSLKAQTEKLEKIYQKKIVDLEEMRKSILQKAFNGEL